MGKCPYPARKLTNSAGPYHEALETYSNPPEWGMKWRCYLITQHQKALINVQVLVVALLDKKVC